MPSGLQCILLPVDSYDCFHDDINMLSLSLVYSIDFYELKLVSVMMFLSSNSCLNCMLLKVLLALYSMLSIDSM
jgi:hypothetical protein